MLQFNHKMRQSWAGSAVSVTSSRRERRDCPGGPVIKTPHFQCREHSWIPCWGAKIPRAVRQKKRKRYLRLSPLCSLRAPIQLDSMSLASGIHILPEPWLHFLSTLSLLSVSCMLYYIIELVQWVYYSSISQKRKLWLREAYSKLFKYTQLESGGTGFQFLMDSAMLSAPWAAQLCVSSLELRQHWSPGQNCGLQGHGSRSF